MGRRRGRGEKGTGEEEGEGRGGAGRGEERRGDCFTMYVKNEHIGYIPYLQLVQYWKI